MKVPYNEEIANHIGPESCGCCGNTVASGEDVGRGKHRQWSRQLSSENTTNWVLTLLYEGEGKNFAWHLFLSRIPKDYQAEEVNWGEPCGKDFSKKNKNELLKKAL